MRAVLWLVRQRRRALLREIGINLDRFKDIVAVLADYGKSPDVAAVVARLTAEQRNELRTAASALLARYCEALLVQELARHAR